MRCWNSLSFVETPDLTFCGGCVVPLQLSRFFVLIVLCVLRPPRSPRQPWLTMWVRLGAHFPQGYSFSCRGKPSYSAAVGLDHRETMAAIKSTGCCLFLAQAITTASLLLNSAEACDS